MAETLGSTSPLRSSPADAVDAVPSDVSQNDGDSATYQSDFSMANDLLQTIYSGVGDGYIPYSEADKRYYYSIIALYYSMNRQWLAHRGEGLLWGRNFACLGN